MICDAWTCLKAYTQIPGLEEAAAFLQTADTLPCGEYPLSGGNFVRIQEYETRPEEECRWEAHRSYADLQVILQEKRRLAGRRWNKPVKGRSMTRMEIYSFLREM